LGKYWAFQKAGMKDCMKVSRTDEVMAAVKEKMSVQLMAKQTGGERIASKGEHLDEKTGEKRGTTMARRRNLTGNFTNSSKNSFATKNQTGANLISCNNGS
jgi:hypothetical protein